MRKIFSKYLATLGNSKNKQKIMLLSHEMTYTGAPRSLLYIADELKKKKHEVDVWTIQDGLFRNEYENRGYDVKQLSTDWDTQLEELKKYDLIIANTVFCLHFAYYIQAHVKTILWLREAQNIHTIAVNCGIDDELLKKIENIVCVSEYARDYIESFYGISGIKVIHNWIPRIRGVKLNIVRKGIIHFCVSGTLEERKQQKTVIDAFRLMPNELKKKCVLHIVGNNPEWSRDYWEQFLPVFDENIVYHGEIADEKERWRLYEKMNVFVVPSLDEACSLVALEGALLGKALILSENIGAKYLIKKEKNLFLSGNVEQLCRKLCEYTSRRVLIEMGFSVRYMYKRCI